MIKAVFGAANLLVYQGIGLWFELLSGESDRVRCPWGIYDTDSDSRLQGYKPTQKMDAVYCNVFAMNSYGLATSSKRGICSSPGAPPTRASYH